MKNLKIRRKLLSTFGIIIALFIVMILLAISSLGFNSSKFENFYTNGYPVANQVASIQNSIQASAKLIGYSMMTDDNSQTASYIQQAKNELDAIQAGINYLQQNFLGDPKLVDSFYNSINSIATYQDQVFELALHNKNEEASKLYFENVMPGYLSAQTYLNQIHEIATQASETEFSSAQRAETISIILLSAISFIVLVVALALALYLSTNLTRPIYEIESAAKEISMGNLNVDISYQSHDELGSLSDSVRSLITMLKHIVHDINHILTEMADGNFRVKTASEQYYIGDFAPLLQAIRQINSSLSLTLSNINQSADQVNNGSEQVANSAQSLSQGTTEQASSIEELAATIAEISENVKANADNAQQARVKSEQAGVNIENSNEKMQSMIEAMSEISTKSNEIGKIIKTIEDIAFQTNILALNAAVEAARAGTAGKGFAVVADEVRNLASKSAEAAKSTTALIAESVRSVQHGTQMADETATSLIEVVNNSKQINDLIDKIAAASAEQASSIQQVTQGVDQISSVIQTNSATAEESAAASEELSGQAKLLKDLVDKFDLKDTSQVVF